MTAKREKYSSPVLMGEAMNKRQQKQLQKEVLSNMQELYEMACYLAQDVQTDDVDMAIEMSLDVKERAEKLLEKLKKAQKAEVSIISKDEQTKATLKPVSSIPLPSWLDITLEGTYHLAQLDKEAA